MEASLRDTNAKSQTRVRHEDPTSTIDWLETPRTVSPTDVPQWSHASEPHTYEADQAQSQNAALVHHFLSLLPSLLPPPLQPKTNAQNAMSDPPSTSSIVILDPHHQPLILSPPPAAASLAREYRKGNWTLQETLVLIAAKKMDDERRASAQSSKPSSSSASSPSTSSSCKTAELRWKWVENYCWSHGCHRSQNQCNDKWDNLLRDYKKVRDYESRPVHPKDRPSYWQMEKHARKERNLPSNLLLEVFQALHEVVTRRYSQKSSAPAGGGTPTAVLTRPVGPPSLPPPPPLLPLAHLQGLPPPSPPSQPPASGTSYRTANAVPPTLSQLNCVRGPTKHEA